MKPFPARTHALMQWQQDIDIHQCMTYVTGKNLHSSFLHFTPTVSIPNRCTLECVEATGTCHLQRIPCPCYKKYVSSMGSVDPNRSNLPKTPADDTADIQRKLHVLISTQHKQLIPFADQRDPQQYHCEPSHQAWMVIYAGALFSANVVSLRYLYNE